MSTRQFFTTGWRYDSDPRCRRDQGVVQVKSSARLAKPEPANSYEWGGLMRDKCRVLRGGNGGRVSLKFWSVDRGLRRIVNDGGRYRLERLKYTPFETLAAAAERYAAAAERYKKYSQKMP